MTSHEGAAKLPLSWQFYPLVNDILWGQIATHYWMVCDYEMLDYCGIFKGMGQLKLQS
jgi:hypothetical protein